MIKTEKLTKIYDAVKAVDSLTFELESGNVVGFLGPNGAGKTTTMRMLAGYLPPTSGRASVMGMDVSENAFEVKKSVGYLPENNPLYTDMTPIEYLEFCADIRGMGPKEKNRRIREVIEICGLQDAAVRQISVLSKGFKQRVGIAQAVLHDPPVLLLDEPTSGLDPNQIQEIRNLINELKGRKTIIISTHIMQEVQAVCQRVVIINAGKIVADGTQDELTSKGKTVYAVKLAGPSEEVLSELEKLGSVEKIVRTGDLFKIETSGQDPRRQIFETAVKKDWTILEMQKLQHSLEEVFRNLTSGEE
ncbi:MAG: ATP-binding cassette domain-containing protein [Elusimicrobiota bacterium]